jgi:subtilisin-like proprotein convertase family protein
MRKKVLFRLKSVILSAVILFAGNMLYGQQLIAYWNFNDNVPVTNTNWDQPITSTIGNAQITFTFSEAYSYIGTTINGIPEEDEGGSFAPRAGQNLTNNGAYFTMSASTTGYQDIILSYPIRKTSTGFGEHKIEYTVNGTTWLTKEIIDISDFESNWLAEQLVTVNFSDIAGVNNNPDFAIRVILNGATNDLGNNRFDNIRISGAPFEATGLPLNIPDGLSDTCWQSPGTSLTSTITITGVPGNVVSINQITVNIILSHSWIGDLSLSITPPGGSPVSLISRLGTGACGSDFDFSFSNLLSFNGTNLSSIPVSNPIPAGNYLPTGGEFGGTPGNMADLIGSPFNGDWVLTVVDGTAGDAGQLHFFSIEIDPTVCPPTNVIYVKASASGANNGTSWTDAFTDLQDALNSTCPGITEIWVAAGTYYPTSGIDRNISFVLKNNLAIFGGFEGTEDPLAYDLEDRNFVANETILSGDIGTVGGNSDNSYTVVNGSGTDATAVIDGFTITGGNSNNNDFASLPTYTGGGMYNSNGSPTVTNCSFSGNSADYGGGMFNDNSSPMVTNCSFSFNLANVDGGGMFNYNNSSPTVTNCSFSGNIALDDGGGIYFLGDEFTGNFRMVNCLFYNNSAGFRGGAIGYDDQSGGAFEIINTTFYNNTAADAGGVLGITYWDSGLIPPTFNNCIGWGNSSTFGQTSANQGIAVFNNTLIQETDCPAGATCNTVIFGQDPLFEDTFTNNFQLTFCSPAINAGSNAAVPAGITTDLDGNARIFGGTVDMGAFEAHFCGPVSIAIVNPDFEILYKAGSTTVTSPPLTDFQQVFGEMNLGMEGPTVTFSDNTTGNMFDMAGWTFNTLMGVSNSNSNFTDPRDMIAWMNGASFGGGTDEKTMSQILAEDVQQNTMYELTADFGWRDDNSNPSPPVLRLYAGATLLTPVTSVDPPLVQGGFVTYSRTYYVDDPGITGPLRIEFGMAANTDGQQLNTDRIRLTKTPEDCSLLPGEIASSQTICSGNMPDPFTSISPASGIIGDLEYQWQISTAIPTFEDIAGAVSETYTHTDAVTQTTWFRRLAKVACQTEWVASNEVQVDVNPLPIAIISGIIDDFEVANLPNGTDPFGNGIGFITFGDFWAGTTVDITTTLVADTDPLAMPGQSGDNYLLRFEANINDFGGVTHAFENENADTWVTQDWSSYEGIAFWIYGQNTGNSLYFEIQDNRNPGSTVFDVELWTYAFTDNFSGWKLFVLDFNDFTRKEIGNGAPNDGFGREEVHGWVFGALNTGGATATYYLDNVMVYGDGGPFCPYTTINFSAPAGMATYAWSLSFISGYAEIGSWDDFLGLTPGTDNEQNVQVVGVCGTVFTLTLTVTDAQGCSASVQNTFVVEESGLEWVNEPQDYSVDFNMDDLEAEVQNWLNSMEASSSCSTVTGYYLPLLQVNSPGDIQEYYISGRANFGPSEFNVTGDLEMADPVLACDPLLNDLTNKIAIIDRGFCTFTSKVKNAQDAGAIAAIVINSNPGQGVFTMGGADPTITIPTLFISYEDGLVLKDAIQQGLVNVTLRHFIDLQPGDYSVLFRATTQCQVIEKTVTLHIEDTPVNLDLSGLVIGENDSECFGATQNITIQNASVAAGGSLTLIAGNSIIITPDFNVELNGYFRAYISDEYCTLPASLLALEAEVENNPALDFNENLSDDLRIFPNPTTGGFTIEMGETFGSNKTSVSIYNLVGELILTNENVLNQAEFNISEYPNGIYVVLIRNNENTEIRKLIKQ